MGSSLAWGSLGINSVNEKYLLELEEKKIKFKHLEDQNPIQVLSPIYIMVENVLHQVCIRNYSGFLQEYVMACSQGKLVNMRVANLKRRKSFSKIVNDVLSLSIILLDEHHVDGGFRGCEIEKTISIVIRRDQ
jgi:hypothetical protein